VSGQKAVFLDRDGTMIEDVGYLDRLERLKNMPDAGAVETLVREGVRYVIIHTRLYRAGVANEVLTALAAHSRLRELGRFDDGVGDAVVFLVR